MGLGKLLGGLYTPGLCCCYPPSVCQIGVGLSLVQLAVVVSLPRRGISLAFANGGGGLIALLSGLPRVRKQYGSSEDGGGARAASAGLQLLWLGLFEVVQAATTAVGFSPRRCCLS